MKMEPDECVNRLRDAEFGVLGTVDARHGVHLVPVVFIVVGDRLVIPIDTVKAKASQRLRRIGNLEHDDRATILVDGRSADWLQLWWVRASLRYEGTADHGSWVDQLSEKYSQYDHPGTVSGVLTFSVLTLDGWQAS
jgi:PPOX class probable F420-dependent enzyme